MQINKQRRYKDSRRKSATKTAWCLVIALQSKDAPSPPDNLQAAIDYLQAAIKFIFSWIILMPISVIIGGKLLAEVLKLRVRSNQLFKITIPKLFVIQATDNEVILGFTGFIITLVCIAVPVGRSAYLLFREQFGIDPGQFNSLCALSSFATVIWTFILYVLLFLAGKVGTTTTDPIAEEHEELMDKLSKGEKLSEEEREDKDEPRD